MVQWRTLVAGAMMLGSSLAVAGLAVAGETAEQWVQKMLSAALAACTAAALSAGLRPQADMQSAAAMPNMMATPRREPAVFI